MKKLWVLLAGGMIAGGAMAQSLPFNASLTPDIALCNREDLIEGVTLSIWGENPQTALAIGLVNGSVQQSGGISIGIVNYAENYAGVHWGVVNYASQDFTGWQGGPIFWIASALNYTEGTLTGVQIGAVNYAGNLAGVQLGLVNYAGTAAPGVQIGLLNLMPENVWFDNFPNELAPGMVLVNWRF